MFVKDSGEQSDDSSSFSDTDTEKSDLDDSGAFLKFPEEYDQTASGSWLEQNNNEDSEDDLAEANLETYFDLPNTLHELRRELLEDY